MRLLVVDKDRLKRSLLFCAFPFRRVPVLVIIIIVMIPICKMDIFFIKMPSRDCIESAVTEIRGFCAGNISTLVQI